MSQDVDRRNNAHRKAGRLPFTQLGDPAIEVLHFGLDVYAACDAERREIMARRTMTPHGYNESLGGGVRGIAERYPVQLGPPTSTISRGCRGGAHGQSHARGGSRESCRVRRRSCEGAVLGGVLGCGRALAQWHLCGADRTARGSWTRRHLRDAAGCGGEPPITLATGRPDVARRVRRQGHHWCV